MRTIQPGFIGNFLKVTEHTLCQTWIGRALFGGIYIELDSVWTPVDVIRIAEDGTRFFRTQYSGSSFHETLNGITRIQEFV